MTSMLLFRFVIMSSGQFDRGFDVVVSMKLIPMVESSKKGFTWPDPAVLEAVHKHIA